MRLTILGSSASYADAGRACSGYLIENAGTRVLLDCGHGVLANLTQVIDPAMLDELPCLARLLEAMEERPSVKRAMAAEGISAPFFRTPSPPNLSLV